METRERGLILTKDNRLASLRDVNPKTQTRRICKESFVYSLTDDRIYGILTDNNVNSKEYHNGKVNIEVDSSSPKCGLQSWLGWANLLSDEIQRLWEKDVRGLVSVKRMQGKGGLSHDYAIPQQQEDAEIGTSSCLYGISRDAESQILTGATFGWKPTEQQTRKSKMGYAGRELDGQKDARQRLRRREAPNGEIIQQGLRTFEVGNQGWSVQSATSSKSLGNVSGWHLAYNSVQINTHLYMKEPYQILRTWYKRQLVEGVYLNDDPTQVDKPFDSDGKGILFSDEEWKKLLNRKWPHRKTSARFMYKSLARHWFEVEKVRCERVQDITPEDCEAEGIVYNIKEWLDGYTIGMRSSFQELWDSINYDRGYGWDKNNWVFAYTYKKIIK